MKKVNIMIVGVLNQKGGVGKTTLSIGIAAELARQGARVLLIDADPQGSSLDWAAAREESAIFTVVGLPRATIHKEIENLRQNYDHVVIDGPPRVTDMARSAIMASDIVVIPVQPSPYDIWAAEEVVKLIAEARVYKDNLKSCFVINRKISNTAIGRDVVEALSGYDLPVLKSAVAQRVIFAESAAQGKAIFEVDANSAGVSEIEAVVNELMKLREV
jgi:chromosome partitioning protein